ncbi:ExbD/TolR family protein [Roseovarius sp. C7]|uniref:ExbD/TolR family protein n=1 Tax=Roseovarius sp. C7 TaxID=3398643 RepID=UPI0039F68770
MIKPRQRSKREPTIALINIVFLMLVFFMVAGTLAQPLDPELKLVKTEELDGIAPPDALVVHADGRLSYRGEAVASGAAFLADREADAGEDITVRLVPDRALEAAALVKLTAELRRAGAARVLVVTERGLQ